jgi:hypothetical protein
MPPARMQVPAVLGPGPPAALDRFIESRWAIELLLAAHVVSLTLYGTLLHGWGSLHHDMLEAWAWGQEFQLGYAKHPPVFAWVAGLWFQLMPRTNWSFTLLAAVNSAVGVLGVWKIAGLLLAHERARLAALVLLLLTPFFTYFALKFNANTILLSLWPWTGYFFIRSLKTRGLVDGLVFGVMGGLALCGKYYSALLLMSCFAASLLYPQARAYYRSAAPYAAILAFLLTVAPHAWWVLANGMPTVEYALEKTRSPVIEILLRGGNAVLAILGFLLIPASVFAFTWRDRLGRIGVGLGRSLRNAGSAWLVVLAVGPFALTLLACVLANVRISSQFMIPAWFLGPPAFLALSGAVVTRPRLRMLTQVALAMMAASVAIAPMAGYAIFQKREDGPSEPRQEAAIEATRIWHAAFSRPLDVVSGDPRYAQGISFYSPDAPSHFAGLDIRKSPWITPQRLAHGGLLMVCEAADAGCTGLAEGAPIRYVLREDRQLAVSFLGQRRPERTIRFYLFAPAGTD